MTFSSLSGVFGKDYRDNPFIAEPQFAILPLALEMNPPSNPRFIEPGLDLVYSPQTELTLQAMPAYEVK